LKQYERALQQSTVSFQAAQAASSSGGEEEERRRTAGKLLHQVAHVQDGYALSPALVTKRYRQR
jgi:hypothetical protein